MCNKDKSHVKQTNDIFPYIYIYNKLQQYLIEHACTCIWICFTLICVNWTGTENKERRERERERERERGVCGGVCGCPLGEPLRQQDTFQTSLYIQNVLDKISSCSYESVGLPQVKSLRSKIQSLGSKLRFRNNIYLAIVWFIYWQTSRLFA